jgi:hypothetical protein
LRFYVLQVRRLQHLERMPLTREYRNDLIAFQAPHSTGGIEKKGS